MARIRALLVVALAAVRLSAAELDQAVESLRQRRKSTYPVGAVEEDRGSGDQYVEAGEPTSVEVIDELAERLETLVPTVSADSLNGLDFVEHEHETGTSTLLEHGEETAEEP